MADDKKQILLEAGIELLSRKTFSEISMDKVAELSGLSKPMLYYYFESKEGYYKALADNLFSMAEKLMVGVVDPKESLRDNLTRYVEMRLKFVDEQPGLVRAFTSILYDPNIGLLLDDARDRFDSMRTLIIDPLFDRAVESGEISPDTDRMLVLMMINSTIIGHSIKKTANLNMPCDETPDPLGMVEMIFDGISTEGTKGGAS